MKKKMIVWIRTVLLLSVAGGLSGCGGSTQKTSAPGGGNASGKDGAPVAVAVECAPLIRGEIRDVREFTGSLEPRARYLSAPKIAGRLVQLKARIGDPVEPDEVIARLDDAEAVQAVEQARASLEVARATVEQQGITRSLAEREKERVRLLRERGIASEAEWDTVQSDFQAQDSKLRVAQAQESESQSALKAAEVRLSYTQIRPLDNTEPGAWVVEERFVDEGAMLSANMPIVSVSDISRLMAVIQLVERDYSAMRPGLSVTLETDAYPGESFTGEVARVAPALRESSRQARVEVEVPNQPPRLRPGMFVRVRIEFERKSDALLAPRVALVSREGKSGLFVLNAAGTQVRFVPVRVGIRSADQVEILDPVLTGSVVTLGQHLLSDGAAVRVCEPGAAAPAGEGPSK